MQDFEKLGLFYLGRRYDMAAGRPLDDLRAEVELQRVVADHDRADVVDVGVVREPGRIALQRQERITRPHMPVQR